MHAQTKYQVPEAAKHHKKTLSSCHLCTAGLFGGENEEAQQEERGKTEKKEKRRVF